ncbi:ATPase [Sphingomonas ginkgonis]|uniref:ATPase n=1 Tax=Sphingomonas ginkgonis TaxID=2315330 RepID=A0A3R9Y5M1_9SPHN|nr:SRPBCC family protein [Sphingomonas ginkgonis]RST30593.1 ATPase [Sphingomonas ginkgonis]
MRTMLLAVLTLGAAVPAPAAVLTADDHGFEVEQSVALVVPPAQAFAAFASLPAWWDPRHSYGGKAENLSLDLRPGGCFCERLPGGGGVEHLRVTAWKPGDEAVLTGALGPLLKEAVSGVMDVRVEEIAGGSRLTINYRAAGFARGGADKLAPAVDGMLAGQLKRLRAYAANRPRS